jgi:hypothetical protein
MSGRVIPLSLVTVSAALAANSGSNAFVLSANPLGPMPISVIFQAAWDGGDVTITGTAIADLGNPGAVVPYTEVVPAPIGGGTVETVRPFATVTAASKAAVGASANTAQLKTLFPTQPPLKLGGAVAGGVDIHANLLILKGFVTTGAVAIVPIFWEEDRWWVQPGGTLAVDDTMVNNSNVGRYVTTGDPTTNYHLFLTGAGTLDAAYLRGKVGPLSI